jgi:hypothetical protein
MGPYGAPFNLTKTATPLKRVGGVNSAPLIPAGSKLIDSKDYKVDLSEAAKNPVSPPSSNVASIPSVAMPSTPSLPDLPGLPDAEPVKEVAKEIAKDEALEKAKAAAKLENKIKFASVRKPAIVFVTGLQAMFSPSKSEGSYAGVGRMAEAVEGSRLYNWDQKDEIIEHIKKTHPDFPIILVGHSLGGDTVKEIADELDSLEHNFRSVDLLVTLDAVGFNNDIIPQNVKEHLNVFAETNVLLNDGPHVARRHDKTSVKNILSPLDHTDLDDAKDIQYEIVQAIEKSIKNRRNLT